MYTAKVLVLSVLLYCGIARAPPPPPYSEYQEWDLPSASESEAEDIPVSPLAEDIPLSPQVEDAPGWGWPSGSAGEFQESDSENSYQEDYPNSEDEVQVQAKAQKPDEYFGSPSIF